MIKLPPPQKIKLIKKYTSKTGAVKFLWLLKDNEVIESTYFAHYVPFTHFPYKSFLRISTMVGCPVKCRFCATTFAGKFLRNLKAEEIIDEVLGTYNYIRPSIRNLISFTGIGEPLLNYEAVIKSIEYFYTSNKTFRQFQFDLDTVGIVPKIYELAKEGFEVNLSISLHTSNNYLRDKLIPFNRKYPIEEILEAGEYYAKTTGRKVLIHYMLIKNFNDSIKNVKELIQLLRGKPFILVLRKMNPVDRSEYSNKIISYKELEFFKKVFQKNGIQTIIFKRKVFDLPDAACGQLRQRYIKGIGPFNSGETLHVNI